MSSPRTATNCVPVEGELYYENRPRERTLHNGTPKCYHYVEARTMPIIGVSSWQGRYHLGEPFLQVVLG